MITVREIAGEPGRGHAGMAGRHPRRLPCHPVGPAGGVAVYRGAGPGSARESRPRGERVDGRQVAPCFETMPALSGAGQGLAACGRYGGA
jgi:hypothetical protein